MIKTYDILIVHLTKMFDAERVKGEAIVFTDHWSCDEDLWSLVKCDSEEQRKLLLKIMINKEKENMQW